MIGVILSNLSVSGCPVTFSIDFFSRLSASELSLPFTQCFNEARAKKHVVRYLSASL